MFITHQLPSKLMKCFHFLAVRDRLLKLKQTVPSLQSYKSNFIFKLYELFIDYENVKWMVGYGVGFLQGRNHDGKGPLPIEQPCLFITSTRNNNKIRYTTIV